MKKHFSKATPISVILNLILIINVIIVIYPVLFTISSSLTKSNSLAATSVIPFTEQTDKSTVEKCEVCDGKGYRYIDVKSVTMPASTSVSSVAPLIPSIFMQSLLTKCSNFLFPFALHSGLQHHSVYTPLVGSCLTSVLYPQHGQVPGISKNCILYSPYLIYIFTL